MLLNSLLSFNAKKQVRIGYEEKGGLGEDQEGKQKRPIHYKTQIPSTPN